MKTMKTILATLLLFLAMSTVSFAQHTNALMFTLNGLSNVSTSNYNQGVGVKHYFDTSHTTFTRVSANVNSTNSSTNYGFSAGYFNTPYSNQNVSAFCGVEGQYDTWSKAFLASGVFGTELSVWNNVNVSAEYALHYNTDTSVLNLNSSGNLTLLVYFN